VGSASAITLWVIPSRVGDEIMLMCRSWSASMGIAGATHS